MISFDITADQWLDVIYVDGTLGTVNLRDAYKNAHKIVRIRINSASYIDELATKIFLALFFTIALIRENKRRIELNDLEDILEEGQFNPSIIDNYIKECLAAGLSFNLFDKDKPFMQAPLDLFGDTKKLATAMVSDLSPIHPSGSKTIFFEKQGSKVGNGKEYYPMSPGEFFEALLALQLLAPAGGSGYAPSRFISQNPLWLIPEGNTLFETILLMIPIMTKSESKQLPLWERPYGYDSFNHEIGFISDSFAPVRLVRWAEINQDGNVTAIYKKNIKIESKASSAHGKESLTNYPYFLSRTDNGKARVLSIIHPTLYFDTISELVSKAPLGDESAGLGGYIYNLFASQGLLSLSYLKSEIGQKYIGYGVSASNADYILQRRFEFTLPSHLADADRRNAFSGYLKYIKQKYAQVFYACIASQGLTEAEFSKKAALKDKPPAVEKVNMLSNQIKLQFSDAVWDNFQEMVKEIDQIDKAEEYDEWLKKATSSVKRAVIEAYEDVVPKHSGKMLDWTSGLEVLKGKPDVKNKPDTLFSRYTINKDRLRRTLKKEDLYTLRKCLGKQYSDCPYAVLLVNSVFPEVLRSNNAKIAEHVFLYSCLLAADILSENEYAGDDPGKDMLKFQDYLFEHLTKSDSGKQRVELLLSKTDIFESYNVSVLLRLLKTAKASHKHIDIELLCEDLERWDSGVNSTRIQWAEEIGRKINEQNEAQKEQLSADS